VNRSFAPAHAVGIRGGKLSAAAAGRLDPEGATQRAQRRLAAVLLFTAVVLFLLPFYWLVITGVKPADQIFAFPPVFWPREFVWRNFYEVWRAAPFGHYLFNTVLITVFSVLGHTLVAALVGYGFAVARFRGRNLLFLVLLATMMIPDQITMIPLFVMFRYVGWIDTVLPLIVPPFFGVKSAFYIFLLRQFFLTIPVELEEAARVDGASRLRIWWSIYVPLSKPALTAVAVFAFVAAWNDFLFPLIFLTTQENWTLTLGMLALANPQYIDYRQMMAAALLVSAAPLVVFFLSQRLFTEGVTMTGLKG
jgi:multiple sugar transport system permease protein